jgi:pimeloyl-ACP methyl ester carboxylesterase
VVAGGEVPETQYVSVGDADVAYQVHGDGPLDMLGFNGLGSHLDLAWQVADLSAFFTRMASLGRQIRFDRRGTGMSDGVARDAIPTWEDLAEDAGAVLDAVGSPRAVILAWAETGPMAVLFAAMHPHRVAALVLLSTYARYQVADDYPIGVSAEAIDAIVAMVQAEWGTQELVRVALPSRADDPEFLKRVSAMHRASATPPRRRRTIRLSPQTPRRAPRASPHSGADPRPQHPGQPVVPRGTWPLPRRAHRRGAIRRTDRTRHGSHG